MSYTIDIDTGGTFTDGFFNDGSRCHIVKVDTTPHDLTLGFHACIEQGALQLGFGHARKLLRETEIIRFSTTLSTNLLIQYRGPKLGLMVTEGYEKSLYGGDGEPGFESLIDSQMVVGVKEELDETGQVVTVPQEQEVAAKARYLLERGARVLVVSLRRASMNADNERRVKQILDLAYPPHYLGYIPVLLSHQVSCRPEDRWRTQASLINAYLHGELMRSLYKAEDDLRQKGSNRPMLVVHANGGTARAAKTRAIDTYNSGPAAALYGAAHLAKQMNLSRVITLDIGGTSTEIGLIFDGTPLLDLHGRIAGLTVGLAISSLETLGGGGGSIARIHNGTLHVGPDSAGALPGPACYDLGGLEPTITDACLVLGYLDPHYFLGGQRTLNAEKPLEVIGSLSSELEGTLHQTALSMIDRLEQNIAEVIHQKTGSQKLLDWSLFAFGGSGGLHAASIAEVLGIRDVFTFPFGSVFSAYGSSTLDVVHIYETCLMEKIEPKAGTLLLGDWFRGLVEKAQRDMEGEGYEKDRIQYQLQVELSSHGKEPTLLEYDVTAHQTELMIEDLPDACDRITVIRLRASVALSHYQLQEYRPSKPSLSKALKGNRSVYWKASPEKTAIYQREELPEEASLDGPLIIESKETTVLVPRGWRYQLDPYGIGILERVSI